MVNKYHVFSKKHCLVIHKQSSELKPYELGGLKALAQSLLLARAHFLY